MTLFVVVPDINHKVYSPDIDYEYNYPKIKNGCFIEAPNKEDAIQKAVKQLGYTKTTFGVMEWKPNLVVSFKEPVVVLKEITASGEVLPL